MGGGGGGDGSCYYCCGANGGGGNQSLPSLMWHAGAWKQTQIGYVLKLYSLLIYASIRWAKRPHHREAEHCRDTMVRYAQE